MKRPLLIMLVILTGVIVMACAAPVDVSELESRVASLETQLSEKETTIQMLQSQLRDREATITDLETQVAELEELLKEATAPITATFEPIVITGSGDKTSPPFAVTTEEWVIDWSYVPDSEYPEWAMFGFFVYPRGETVSFVEQGLFMDETEGSTYSYAGAGEYYIEVMAGNIKSWEIVISPAR